jgi:hypothetical protein
MAVEEPLRQELHFADERRAVVGRQGTRRLASAGLQAHERIERIAVEALHVAPRQQIAQVLALPEIREQQQPALEIACQDHGNVQSDADQRLRDADERRERLLLRRRIHHDVGMRAAGQAKIAAKARIRRGGLDARLCESQVLRDPLAHERQAGIACIHHMHA